MIFLGIGDFKFISIVFNEMSAVDKDWNALWKNKDIGWDLGGPTPALVDHLSNTGVTYQTVLVPGCGNGNPSITKVKFN